MTPARSALLLSGSIGLGHDVASRACADVLRQQGWSTDTLDAMRMLGRGSGAAGETVFRTMLAVPGLFDAVHFGALRTGNRLALATSSLARRRLVPQLRDYLERHPVQLLISAFATGAAAASAVAAEHPAMVHVVLCTDATPHRIWVQPNVDMYLVTSEVAELAVLRFQPDALVHVVPQPVRSVFYQPRGQAQARSRFDIPVGERCVLLLSGGWGLGPVAAAAEALAAAGLHVLAVAGHNEGLAQKLAALAAAQPRVRAFGFTDQVPDLMAAADLVITPAGAATCAEARVVGRPLLLLDVVQGHGRDNLQHELELGDAMVTSSAAADVARCALAALDRSKPAQPGPASSPLAWEAALTTAVTSIGL
ncbi:MAG TPA: glycosyltransferase [Streptosporangiaceae bacterium]|nr:glycosyltransferase [Streptosporangiaceae bacterium]